MIRTIGIAILSVALVCAVIIQPDEAFKASMQGLSIWWNVVFPGLLPFLVVLEMMSAFGLSRALGVLAQPLTQRFLKLPGDSGLAVAAGWMSGFPAGAETTARLVRSNRLQAYEGAKLLAFSHMPNPVFMLVVFGAGFLHKPQLGLLLALSVWLSGLLAASTAAVISAKPRTGPDKPAKPRSGIWRRAAEAMEDGRREDGRGFGQVLGESVTVSVQKLMVVGGLIMLASVVSRLLTLMLPEQLPGEWLQLLLPILLESHLGAYAAASADIRGMGAPVQLALAAAALSWSGVSGILQAGQAAGGTGIKLLPLAATKLLHALLAFGVTLLLWKPALSLLQAWGVNPASSPAMAGDGTVQAPLAPAPVAFSDLPAVWPYSVAGALFLAVAGIAAGLLLLPFIWRRRLR
ncbi:nucleoside recognition protein [Paenibacillus thailandensis]|uniref:Nucleoside recognition protein n=1 Tax=Paenibacillus thailandensis TaxID=393250 RepID=A0ABW5QX55_9BACL